MVKIFVDVKVLGKKVGFVQYTKLTIVRMGMMLKLNGMEDHWLEL
jgi:hypothetical protein